MTLINYGDGPVAPCPLGLCKGAYVRKAKLDDMGYCGNVVAFRVECRCLNTRPEYKVEDALKLWPKPQPANFLDDTVIGRRHAAVIKADHKVDLNLKSGGVSPRGLGDLTDADTAGRRYPAGAHTGEQRFPSSDG